MKPNTRQILLVVGPIALIACGAAIFAISGKGARQRIPGASGAVVEQFLKSKLDDPNFEVVRTWDPIEDSETGTIAVKYFREQHEADVRALEAVEAQVKTEAADPKPNRDLQVITLQKRVRVQEMEQLSRESLERYKRLDHRQVAMLRLIWRSRNKANALEIHDGIFYVCDGIADFAPEEFRPAFSSLFPD